jgi:DNA-directed RNA polymerase subunit RPC12/RpoP
MPGAVGIRAMKFSTSDLTILRIRCQKCGQHTEKIVTILVRKDAIACSTCGGRISLSTPTNKILIAETAASCARVGEALIKGLNLEGEAV